ncbi:hypothetical protein [Nocardioides coralli]|uniref:hypothetical protein n=1 Tax=Nocardioides coralli TaxID=2872154 RepID=UPI001CA44254|nr:hypothetical protein [Nocardioides coralli]QZY28546.1 hypothetical protein K6T13_13910 [Nocardioides coralli]
MSTRASRAPYAGWRAAAATALVVPAAVLAHTWAGGHVPSTPAVLALAALLLGTSALVLRGTVRTRLLLPFLAAAQVGLHEGFAALEAASHAHHGAAAPAASPWTGRMVLAHAAVVVLTALVWRLCERTAAAVVAATTELPTYVGGRRDPRRPRRVAGSVRAGFCLDLTPLRGPPARLGRA